MANFKYNVEKLIAVIGRNPDGSVKKLALVSWNGHPAKLDLRSWFTEGDEEKPGRGLTLSGDEAAVLADVLLQYLRDDLVEHLEQQPGK